MLAGIIFGLGMSELALILVFVILVMGPQRLKTIKPLLKVLYKNYVGFMGEVNSMQNEMDDMKKSIMEPINDVQREAEEELRAIQKEATSGLKGSDELNKGIQAIIERSKKEITQAKQEAQMAGTDAKLGKMQAGMPGASMARGGQVGLLGRQAPGSSRRMPSDKKEAEVPLASALSEKDKKKLFGAQSPAQAGFSQNRMPAVQTPQNRGMFQGFQRQGARTQAQPNRQMPQARQAPGARVQPNIQATQERQMPREQMQQNTQRPNQQRAAQIQQNAKPKWPTQQTTEPQTQKPLVKKPQPAVQTQQPASKEIKPVKKQSAPESSKTEKTTKKKEKQAAKKQEPQKKKNGKKSKKR